MSDALFWFYVGLGFAVFFVVLGLLGWAGAVLQDATIHQYGWCSNPSCGSKRHTY